jgi:hypothetical protein
MRLVSRLPAPISALLYLAFGLAACGQPESPMTPLPSESSGSSTGSGGAGAAGGTSSTGAGTSNASIAGGGTGGSPAPSSGGAAGTGGESGGAPQAGSAGTGGAAGGDTPAPRPLKVDAAPGEHIHNVNSHAAGLSNLVPTVMGKLIVNLDNGMYQFGLKRGFHVLGVNLPICPIHFETRNHNGDCRLEVFDAVDRDPEITITPEQSVTGQVTSALTQLHAMFPEEDWGYYLNADGSVRWSDVGFTGHSHRAQSATRFAVAVRVYRAVARAGPRDNVCGTGAGTGDFDAQNPPYDPDCPDSEISAWLDEEPKTPVDRLFGFVGKTDEQYGDILFTMERMQFVGAPVNVTTGSAPYGGSHRFYADAGHDGFDSAPYHDALNIAWGVPPENATWAASH